MHNAWDIIEGPCVVDLGEDGLLALIRGVATHHDPSVVVPIGDDAAVFDTNGAPVLTSVDAMVEGQHFRREWLCPAELGRRLFRAAASDILAMGGTPKWLVLSLQLPSDLTVASLTDLITSFQAECMRNECSWIGGNLTRSDTLSLHVTVTGVPLEGGHLWRRSGAQEGDLLWLTGDPGICAAGLSLLLAGNSDPRFESLKERWRSPRNLRDLHAMLHRDCTIHACIDVSDGLLLDASRMARESDKEFIIHPERIRATPILREAAEELNLSVTDWFFTGGESYELLLASPTPPPPHLSDLGAVVIGEVRAREVDSRSFVRVQGEGPAPLISDSTGWDPFSEKKTS